MTSRPHRLTREKLPSGMGRLVDYSHKLTFRFNGRTLSGLEGDTLASALLANGVHVVGRSSRLHRPRGLIAIGDDEPNGIVALAAKGERVPNLQSTTVPLRAGMSAASQNGWPGLRLDLTALAGKLRGTFPAGSAFKTFLSPGGNGWKFAAPFYRRMNAAGRLPATSDPRGVECRQGECDVLVVGGGIAGLAAAKAAATNGASVILCETLPRLGGLSDIDDGAVEGISLHDWSDRTASELRTRDRVRLMTGTSFIDAGDKDEAWLVEEHVIGERSGAEKGDGTQVLWKVRARTIVLATGARERPLVFRGNDRPGVMLASAVRAYLVRYGVVPGEQGIVFTNNDDAYQTALMLFEAGMSDLRIVDTRTQPGGKPVMQCMAAGIRMSFGSYVTQVETRDMGRRITGVTISPIGFADIGSTRERLACDFVCMSGGWLPTAPQQSVEAAFGRSAGGPAIISVGAANGTLTPGDILAEARSSGEAAAKASKTADARDALSRALPAKNQTVKSEIAVLPLGDGNGKQRTKAPAIADFLNDVTVDDIALALREGYTMPEQLEAFTGLGTGMAPGAVVHANAGELGRDGKTAVHANVPLRRPVHPVRLGALAVAARRNAPKNHNTLPEVDDTDLVQIGFWRLPRAIRKSGENLEAAIRREAAAVRSGAALVDLSARGIVEIAGKDATKFLEYAGTATLRNMTPARGVGGLLLDDVGGVVDVCRIEQANDDSFLVTTSIGGSARVVDWLSALHRDRWPDLDVTIADCSADWTRLALVGPEARKVLAGIYGDIESITGAFGIQEGILLGRKVRVVRSFFAGADTFETLWHGDRAESFWHSFAQSLAEGGATPVGYDAIQAARLEHGMINVRAICEANVTASDLGLLDIRSLKKKEFVGRSALEFQAGRGGRHELVGLLTDEPDLVVPAGTTITDEAPVAQEIGITGHVVGSAWSPTLNRSIAAALVRDGRSRTGERVRLHYDRKNASAEIVGANFMKLQEKTRGAG